MEVKSNLIPEERKEALKKFNYPCFKKVARVIMGKPNQEFKDMVQSKILKVKQDKADAAWKQKKAAEAKKKLIEKKQKEFAKKKAEAAAKADGEAEKEPEVEEKEEEEDAEGEAPVVELTEEEKAMDFPASGQPDLTPQVLASSYAKFTTPQDDEGFDSIKYEWDSKEKSASYLKSWVLNKKLTTRIEDLKPGQFFKEKAAEFEKCLKTWQEKQKATKKPAKKAEAEEETEIDIFSVADINDVGGGVPLYAKFAFEDWELVKLRFEYAIMLMSFKKDCDDPDRSGVPVDHLGFYYQKYFRKAINLKAYGAAAEADIFALIKDVVSTKDGLLISQLSDDLESLDIFLKLTEEGRRERQRRIDAGDETARLKFVAPPKPAEKPAAAAPKVAPKADAKPAAKAEAAKMTPAPKKEGKGKGK